MKVNLTLKEAKHLLAYNSGYLSCPLDHDQSHQHINGCFFNEQARKKIRLAIENEEVNII